MPPAAPPLASALTGEARADYESARLLYGDGDYAGALVKFSTAYDRSKDPRLLWNMAACEKNLRRYTNALSLVRRYLKEGTALLSEQDKIDGQELVKVMEPFTATLQLVVDQPGAEVSLDDRVLGTTPLGPTSVDMGRRRLRVHKSGFEEAVRDLSVGGASRVSIDLKLVKILHEGRLIVKAPANATIAIDGRVVGSGLWSSPLPSGGHSLKVTAPGMRVYQIEILVLDKQSREIAVTLEPEPSTGVPGWVWLIGVAAVAGGVATAGYFVFKPEPKYEGQRGNLPIDGLVELNTPFRLR